MSSSTKEAKVTYKEEYRSPAPKEEHKPRPAHKNNKKPYIIEACITNQRQFRIIKEEEGVWKRYTSYATERGMRDAFKSFTGGAHHWFKDYYTFRCVMPDGTFIYPENTP